MLDFSITMLELNFDSTDFGIHIGRMKSAGKSHRPDGITHKGVNQTGERFFVKIF
jgi:hypothetical protein